MTSFFLIEQKSTMRNSPARWTGKTTPSSQALISLEAYSDSTSTPPSSFPQIDDHYLNEQPINLFVDLGEVPRRAAFFSASGEGGSSSS
jgi:hypothetical protein